MEIRKVPVFVRDVALPVRRQASEARPKETPRDPAAYLTPLSKQVAEDELIQGQRRVALQQMEAERRFHDETNAAFQAQRALSHHARKALDAYRVQQTQAGEESDAALRQMLGVDYYA